MSLIAVSCIIVFMYLFRNACSLPKAAWCRSEVKQVRLNRSPTKGLKNIQCNRHKLKIITIVIIASCRPSLKCSQSGRPASVSRPSSATLVSLYALISRSSFLSTATCSHLPFLPLLCPLRHLRRRWGCPGIHPTVKPFPHTSCRRRRPRARRVLGRRWPVLSHGQARRVWWDCFCRVFCFASFPHQNCTLEWRWQNAQCSLVFWKISLFWFARLVFLAWKCSFMFFQDIFEH